MLPLSVIVPVRNAEEMIDDCLLSIARSQPEEIILVDGLSTDRTLEIARRYPVRIISDGGKGVAAARMLGVENATSPSVALIDVDIVLGVGALENLYHEFVEGQYAGLQAGLVSVSSGPGYWGRALASHHNHGLSRRWPGVMATLFQRSVLLRYRLDERFVSGEDIELRWRLRKAGLKLGVSSRTLVTHRFGDTYDFARDQWMADGRGLGRMVSRYGWRAAPLLAIPAAGGIRGVLLSLVHRQPGLIPYYAAYVVHNYLAMVGGLKEPLRSDGNVAGRILTEP